MKTLSRTGWDRLEDGSFALTVEGTLEALVSRPLTSRSRPGEYLVTEHGESRIVRGQIQYVMQETADRVAARLAARGKTLRDRLLGAAGCADHVIMRARTLHMVEGMPHGGLFSWIEWAATREDTLGELARTALSEPAVGLPILRDYAADYGFPDVLRAAEFYLQDPWYTR